MSFRMFVYYCAIFGAWAGLFGWILGQFLAPSVPTGNTAYFPKVLHDSLAGMFLGFAIALALSFLDASFSLSLRKMGQVIARVLAAVLIGVFGGLLGGFVGGSIYHLIQWDAVFMVGWIIVGMLVGMSICFFEFGISIVTSTDFGSAFMKFIKCVVGG